MYIRLLQRDDWVVLWQPFLGGKKLKKRGLGLLLAGMLFVTGLAGCGNAGGNQASENQTSESRTSEAAGGQESEAGTEAENGTQVAEETEASVEKAPNINVDMEDMNAMDVVNNMRIGWNIGNTLDSTSDRLTRVDMAFKFETAWGNPKVTQELIDAVLDAGFNVIRVPVSWTNHMAGEPDYLITESWMDRVQEVVDYAYNKGAYVILNLHHEDWNYPYYDNEEAACARMKAVWSQIAERFQDYDEHLIFEGQNEPRKIGTSVEWTGGDQEGWDVVNATNKAFVEAIRNAGGSNPYRILMIPGYGANSTVGIRHIELPENDDRIVVSVHAYEPYDFALNTAGRSEWNEDTAAIDTLMKTLKELYIDKGTPVIIGEFGAMNKDNESDRAAWAEYYVKAAAEIGVPCVWWDNGLFEGDGERFGLFDRHTYECKYPQLMEALMRGTNVTN